MSHPGGMRRPLSMNISMAGGTGTLGRQAVSQLRARGHEARVLSRKAAEYPVDPDKLAMAAALLDETV
jgi:uncharacterized protein YbjT (DUF2867 family)